MGYDMHQLEPMTKAERSGYETASAAFHAACNHRDELPKGSGDTWMIKGRAYPADWIISDLGRGDVITGTPVWVERQTAVNATAREMDLARVDYFQLNGGGMRLTVKTMRLVPDMIHSEDSGMPPIDWVPVEDDPYESYDRRCLKANPWLGWAPEKPGICDWKFSDNSGWHVTQFECASAVDAWNRYMDSGEVDHDAFPYWWMEWIDYLSRSVNRGGFRVH